LDASLEFRIDGQVLFSSTGKWLHPLFDLEEFLKAREIDASKAEIRDKVVGRGSAFLITRLGVRRVHAGMLSRLGKDVLDRAGAACTWDVLVDEIECRTEGILRDVTDPAKAYLLLVERREAALRKANTGRSQAQR
jgi:zinc transport system ATP-binding protein